MYYVYRDMDRKTEVVQKNERGNVAQTQRHHRRWTECSNLREDFLKCGRNSDCGVIWEQRKKLQSPSRCGDRSQGNLPYQAIISSMNFSEIKLLIDRLFSLLPTSLLP